MYLVYSTAFTSAGRRRKAVPCCIQHHPSLFGALCEDDEEDEINFPMMGGREPSVAEDPSPTPMAEDVLGDLNPESQ